MSAVNGPPYYVLASDYDWMTLDRDSHQRVAMRAMERADKAEADLAELVIGLMKWFEVET